MPLPPITIRDLAKKLGFSPATISMALRNSPEIGEATRKRIQAEAQRLGYQPNAMATALAHYKHTSKVKPVQAAVAWLNAWPNPGQLRGFVEFDCYWKGASETAGKFGYRLDEFVIDQNVTASRMGEILSARGIRGLLIPPISADADSDWWRSFDWDDFSCVRFGRSAQAVPSFHMVTSAQSSNAALAVRMMIQKGYRRIGFVGYCGNTWTFLGGFLQEQQVSIPQADWLPPFPLQNQDDGVSESFIAWLKKWKPDAILTDSKHTSHFLDKAGVRVPDDVGVAALNVLDIPFDAGIYQNPEEIGRVAMLMLISLLHDNDRGIPVVQREMLVKGTWRDGTSLPVR